MHVQDNNPEDGDFIFLSFAKSQNFNKISFITKDWDYTPVVNIYCSDDQTNWFILGDVILTKDETKIEIDIKMPLGNFNYFKIGSKSEDTFDEGYMRNIEFNIIDNPISQEIIRSISKEKSNIQFLRYSVLLTVSEQDKYEIKTVVDESISIDISTLLTSQGSVFLDGKKIPYNGLSFTFDTDKNYLTLNAAPTESNLTIEIERIFI